MPIGVGVGVVSVISFVGRIGNGDGNCGLGGKTKFEELDEDVDGEGGAVKEGEDKPEGLNRDRPESFCNGGRVPIDDSSPEAPSDSANEPGISCRKDEFKLCEDRNEVESAVGGSCSVRTSRGNMKPQSSPCCLFDGL